MPCPSCVNALGGICRICASIPPESAVVATPTMPAPAPDSELSDRATQPEIPSNRGSALGQSIDVEGWQEALGYYREFNAAERTVARKLWRRLWLGIRSYGHFDPQTDRRDLVHERNSELFDAMVYEVLEEVRRDGTT